MVFDNMKVLAKFTNNTSILLIDQDNLSSRMRSRASSSIPLSRMICRRVVGRNGRRIWIFLAFLSSSSMGRLRTLQEGCTLCKYGFECVDIFLGALSFSYTWKLYPCKCPAIRTQIPPWYEVAVWWLVVYLSRCGEGKVELWWEM